QVQLTGEGATLTDTVAARLEEALDSFYLALGRRKPPALRAASPLTARQIA
ncbi:MAG: NADPH-dependent FMN reductase, partial [Serratia marcescens]|nr:NADPH-dependent FMN reductase [Serratia marcescens]